MGSGPPIPHPGQAGPLNEELELLLAVLPIFIKTADMLANQQSRIDERAPYLYMHALCALVLRELSRVKAHIVYDAACIVQLLDFLEGVLLWPTYPQTHSGVPHVSSRGPYERLGLLKSQWMAQKRRSWQSRAEGVESTSSSPSPSAFTFANGRQIRDVLQQLQTVYEFCRLQYPDDSSIYLDEEMQPKRKRAEPAWAVRKAAQSAYQLLTAIKDCMCEPSHPYEARLFLATHRGPGARDHNCDLDMFLSLGLPWQEVRIGAVRDKLESSVKIITSDMPATNPVTTRKKNKKQKQIKNLCKLIKQSRERHLHLYRLKFSVEDGALWNNDPEQSPWPMNLSGGEISLEDFILTRADRLTEMTKRIIAVMLSHGALHLHGTGWIQKSWGPSNVVFHQVASAIPIRPYIHVNLIETATECSATNSDASDDDEDDDDYFGNDDCFAHPFPGLVTLGLMLMRVYLARTFKSFAQEFNMGDPDQLDSNAKFALASLVFKKHASAISFSQQYCYAIDKCLDPNIQYDEDGNVMNEDDLRKVMYDEIVGPLEDELGQGKFSTGTDSFIWNLDTEAQNLDLSNWGQPLTFQRAKEPAQEAINTLPSRSKSTTSADLKTHGQTDMPPAVLSKGQDRFAGAELRRRTLEWSSKTMWLCSSSASDFFDDESKQEDISNQARHDFTSWKEDVLDVYDEFLAPSSGNRPTRIAVLDTGLDLEHPDFVNDEERRQRVKAQQVFTNENSPAGEESQRICDESGHGTHIAGLLLDLAPCSELYIAKIANQHPSPNKYIAEAIKHAVDGWKADIITMSFGFTTRDIPDYTLIEDALEYANSKNVLLFAAASNKGANQMRTFPARHDYVICVHSTAANGVPSGFNAPRGDSNNFATIGEAIESSWPTHLCDREVNESCVAWKSGTSFATPIAVGIAAFLLQYARENLDDGLLKLLRKPQGMRAVFKEISCEKNGYDYIAPKVHPDNLFGKEKEYVKHRVMVVLKSS